MPLNLAILISGGGTTMQNLIHCIAAGKLDAQIKVVIASRPGIAGIRLAEAAGLPVYVVERTVGDVETFSKRVFDLCQDAQADLVCMAGWLSLLKIPETWSGRVMNIHPSLLPDFGGRGMYGQKVHQAALAAGATVSGCTVHFVDDAYDNGPIILQRVCPVLPDDTPQTLAARVFEEEKIAYPQAIDLFAQNRLRIEAGQVRVTADPGRTTQASCRQLTTNK